MNILALTRNQREISQQNLCTAESDDALPDAMPVSTPIYASATFTYESMEEIDQVFCGEKQGFIYTRYGNPTTAALEEAVREVEEGATALCVFNRHGRRSRGADRV